MALDLSQFRGLDINNIGNWPVVAKGAVVGALCAVVLFAGYWFDTQDQISDLNRAQQHEQELKKTFEVKQARAANLDAYKQQMVDMKESFGTMLRQLPSKTEVADLLVDITQTGLASGLHFELFKPGHEIPKDFYAELPIDIKVTGNYHNFGEFASGVVSLPRIVTLHNIHIKIKESKHDSGAGELVMEVTAKTYRYLDEQEIAAARKREAAGKRRRR